MSRCVHSPGLSCFPVCGAKRHLDHRETCLQLLHLMTFVLEGSAGHVQLLLDGVDILAAIIKLLIIR